MDQLSMEHGWIIGGTWINYRWNMDQLLVCRQLILARVCGGTHRMAPEETPWTVPESRQWYQRAPQLLPQIVPWIILIGLQLSQNTSTIQWFTWNILTSPLKWDILNYSSIHTRKPTKHKKSNVRVIQDTHFGEIPF